MRFWFSRIFNLVFLLLTPKDAHSPDALSPDTHGHHAFSTNGLSQNVFNTKKKKYGARTAWVYEVGNNICDRIPLKKSFADV